MMNKALFALFLAAPASAFSSNYLSQLGGAGGPAPASYDAGSPVPQDPSIPVGYGANHEASHTGPATPIGSTISETTLREYQNGGSIPQPYGSDHEASHTGPAAPIGTTISETTLRGYQSEGSIPQPYGSGHEASHTGPQAPIVMYGTEHQANRRGGKGPLVQTLSNTETVFRDRYDHLITNSGGKDMAKRPGNCSPEPYGSVHQGNGKGGKAPLDHGIDSIPSRNEHGHHITMGRNKMKSLDGLLGGTLPRSR